MEKLGQSKKGQIVVEYVLLLVVSVSVALVITQAMVSRNSETPGFLIKKWSELNNFIASDDIESRPE